MIDYADRPVWRTLSQLHGSVLPRSILYSVPSMLLTLGILFWEEHINGPATFRKIIDMSDMTESSIWSISTAMGFVLLAFRVRTAYARFWEGTTLLHQMEGEWFESASCLMAFSTSAKAKKPKEVNEFRQTLVRLMSIMHGSALECLRKSQEVSYEVIDLRGLDLRTLEILHESSEIYGFHRVEVLLHMVQVLMTHNHEIGVLTIQAPILSRVYQTLSRGMVNFINAQKIADTMFPFPFAQLSTWFVCFHSMFIPFVITAIVKHKVWAVAVTMIPLVSMVSLNITAWELEMPYGDDPNDLPLVKLQQKFNAAMLMLLRDSADHVPGTCPRTMMNWESIFYSLWATKEMLNRADSEKRRHFFKVQHAGHNTTKTLDLLLQSKPKGIDGADRAPDQTDDLDDDQDSFDASIPKARAMKAFQTTRLSSSSACQREENTIRAGLADIGRIRNSLNYDEVEAATEPSQAEPGPVAACEDFSIAGLDTDDLHLCFEPSIYTPTAKPAPPSPAPLSPARLRPNAGAPAAAAALAAAAAVDMGPPPEKAAAAAGEGASESVFPPSPESLLVPAKMEPTDVPEILPLPAAAPSSSAPGARSLATPARLDTE